MSIDLMILTIIIVLLALLAYFSGRYLEARSQRKNLETVFEVKSLHENICVYCGNTPMHTDKPRNVIYQNCIDEISQRAVHGSARFVLPVFGLKIKNLTVDGLNIIPNVFEGIEPSHHTVSFEWE